MKIAAITVSTFSVYGVEAALAVVRLQAGSSVEGSTAGNIATNSEATVNPTATVVPTNAQPSPPSRLASNPHSRATTATPATTTEASSPRRPCDQPRKP